MEEDPVRPGPPPPNGAALAGDGFPSNPRGRWAEGPVRTGSSSIRRLGGPFCASAIAAKGCNGNTIRIGTMIRSTGLTEAQIADYIRQILPLAFESFELDFWQTFGSIDLKRLAAATKEALAGTGAVISCIGIYGNSLGDLPEDRRTREDWKKCIDAAHLFDCDLVTGLTGRLWGRPIPESLKPFGKFFGPLAKRAADKGVRIAFENMGEDWDKGGWNIALGPAAWEMMFNEVPDGNVGLEWEPCHQMRKLIDPMPQLRKWGKKVFHLHGKDATILWDVVREHGIYGPRAFALARTPGFGDSNWTDILSELRRGGFQGSIDIEGWHDPVYNEELEMTGQVHALNHLKYCRGGSLVGNPV